MLFARWNLSSFDLPKDRQFAVGIFWLGFTIKKKPKTNRLSISSADHVSEAAGGWDAGVESSRGGFPGGHVSPPGTEGGRSRSAAMCRLSYQTDALPRSLVWRTPSLPLFIPDF